MTKWGVGRSRSRLTAVVGRHSAILSFSLLALPLCPVGVAAQEVERGTSALDLPRPGYEARNLHFGSTVIAPEVTMQGLYDSNVFATSTNANDDFILSIAPRLDATSTFGKVQLRSDAYVTHRQYLDNGRESRTTFGGGTKGNYSISRANTVNFGVRFDREVESRADPEANRNPNLPPRRIDALSADLGYQYRLNRIGIAVSGGVQRQNYLEPDEADRDMTTYRGSMRVSAQISAGKDLFVEGFVNRRDNRLKVDRSGIDRDATTIGFLAGFGLDIGSRWRGDMGAGLFRSNSDDPTLKSFTGFAANGRLTWSPDERTAVTAEVFRGDVGTVRSGASGRVDTRAGLRLDQEIRHNLLLTARAGVRSTTYRGTATSQRQTTAFVGAETEFLLNRYMSVFVNGNFTKRYSKLTLEKFDKASGGIGLRLKY